MDDTAYSIEGSGVIHTMTAGILLVAAGLKAHQLATEPVASDSIFTYRWSLILQVEFELLFGLWLLSGLYRRLTWALAVACFGFFSLVSLYKGLSGEASCGCFGSVEVNPWVTLLLDVGVVAALLTFPPLRRGKSCPLYRLRLAAMIILALGIGLPVGIAAATFEPSVVDVGSGMLGHGNLVLLEPEKWVGRPFPLTEHIDVGKELTRGRWTVVLYRHDCPDCPAVIADYERRARDRGDDSDAPLIALVEVAPPRRGGRHLVGSGSACLLGRLSPDREWFVTTPAILTLRDGRVVEAREGGGG